MFNDFRALIFTDFEALLGASKASQTHQNPFEIDADKRACLGTLSTSDLHQHFACIKMDTPVAQKL